MEIFRKFGIGKGDFLPIPSFSGSIQLWRRDLRDQVQNGLDQLIELKYISPIRDNFSMFLLEYGYNYLYSSFPVSDAESNVLNIFKTHGIDRDKSLPLSDLVAEYRNFDADALAAVNSLKAKGAIKEGPECLILTAAGYDAIHC